MASVAMARGSPVMANCPQGVVANSVCSCNLGASLEWAPSELPL